MKKQKMGTLTGGESRVQLPGEEGMSLWDLLGQGFLREASELGM
jgi:hypothetical protein